MKLKTLLLGSAASLMAVTSSFAADAVVAEPEAVEYVRVCDAYGTGWFYIPGTERCLKLSGEVRFEYQINDSDANTADDVDADWQYRARVAIESANESDFGTIKTYIRLQASNTDPFSNTVAFTAPTPPNPGVGGSGVAVSNGGGVTLQAMTLSIGGAEFGFFDNYYTKNNGYGNLFAMADGPYGYGQSLYAQYTYEVAGFAITAGVEQFQNDSFTGLSAVTGLPNPAPADFAGSEINLYAGANYGGSWGSVAGTVYYDNNLNELDYKISALVKPLEGLQLKAWYLGGDGAYTINATGAAANDYAYGLSAAYTFGDFTPYLGWSDVDNSDAAVAVGVLWTPASTDGLKVQLEANFDVEDDVDTTNQRAYRMRLIKTF